MGFGSVPKGVTRHTELADKEVDGVIDHANLSVTDEKLKSGVGLSDGQICKLPSAAADKVLKRGATAWEAGDVPAPVLEGDYSSYSVYDSFDDSEVVGTTSNAAWINYLETKAILVACYSEDYIKVYDIEAKTLGSSFLGSLSDFINVDTLGWFFKQTSLNTYVGFIEKTTNNLLIYKNGALLQTLTPTNLGLTPAGPYTISFSPRGKYIFLTGTRSASGNKGWVVLVGE
jgi:hypothetical protein